MRRWWLALMFLITLIAGVGCQPARPRWTYQTGDVLLEEDFDRSFVWETYQDARAGTDLRVEDGAYRMQTRGPGYIWGLHVENYDNLVFEAQSAQLSTDPNNAFGLMCRASPGNTGDGYYFLVSGDGYWSIRKRTATRVESIIDFTRTDAINQGQSINTIRILCIDDYLALYVNGQFVGEAQDSTYQTGYVGFVVAVPDETDIDITFDNARVIEGDLVPPP